jgi:hypothetical protein
MYHREEKTESSTPIPAWQEAYNQTENLGMFQPCPKRPIHSRIALPLSAVKVGQSKGVDETGLVIDDRCRKATS